MIKKAKLPRGVFVVTNYVFCCLVAVLCIVPVLHILAISLSASGPVFSGRVALWPVDFSLDNYNIVMRDQQFYSAYLVSICRAAVGWLVSIVLTVLGAYPMSLRKTSFDPQNGWLTSLFDKELGESLLSETAPCGFVLNEEDPAKGMTSWILGRYMRREMLGKARIRQLHTGPLRQSIEVSYCFGKGGSKLTAVFSLDDGSASVRVHTTCDWREVGTADTTVAQLAFIAPLQKPFAKARYAIPGGVIERAQEAQDVPSLGLAVPVTEAPGNTIALTADTKYGMRADENALQVTLIRAAFTPDPLPDLGKHQFALALTAVEPGALDTQLSLPQHLLRPVHSQPATPHAGPLPHTGSFLKIKGEGIRFSGLKRAEGADGFILRLYNTTDKVERAEVFFLPPIRHAYITDIHETAVADNVGVAEQTLCVDIGPAAMMNLHVSF